MTRLLNSGTFWLKTASSALLAALLLSTALYLSAQHFFSPKRIQAFAQAALGDTGRSIRFDSVSGRSWFPRPSVTLKNLTVTNPQSRQPALTIKETRIGLGWQSLWQDRPVIEKWTIDGAEATIQRTPDGRWSLQDLWQQPNRQALVNRLIIRNSTIRLHLIQGEYLIGHFGLNARSADSDGRRFSIEGTLEHPSMPLTWQGGGILKASGKNWLIPAFHLEAQGLVNKETLRIQGDSALEWQPQKSILSARGISLRTDSSYHSFHAATHVPLLVLHTDRLTLPSLNSVFTAESSDGRWNGSLELEKADLHPDNAALASLTLNASHKSSSQTDISVSGPLSWQESDGLKSEKLHITTRQNSPQAGIQTRFAALLDGSFEMNRQGWQGRFQGFFDRQRTALNIKYSHDDQRPLLEAGIALQKLSVEPYWPDMQAQSGALYPSFLTLPSAPKIEAQLTIGSLTLPGMQLEDINTLLTADGSHIALTNFKAGLYGGHTEGGISMANTQPVSYHLQQNARGIQIRPLLQDLLGFHRFSGNGNAVIDLTAKGQNRKSLLASLAGSLSLNISDGIWYGIDIDNILQSGKTEKNAVETLQTPFHLFRLNSTIDKGISRHIDTELSSDRIRVVSNGYTDLGRQELSEDLLIYNRLNPLSRPVPLKFRGPIDNPSLTLDYARLTDGLNSPEEKQKALEKTLREQWRWLIPERKTK